MKKILIYVLAAVIIAAILWSAKPIVGGIIIGGGGIFNFPIGKEKMETIFEKDQELLVVITNYFVDSGFENIYIYDDMETGEISINGEHIIVNDAKVVEAISTLKSRNYSVISKNGNTIIFQRWSNLDNGRGITYSVDGNEPEVQFLTRLEHLSEPNWYYYEEDFNEWRIREQSKGD